MARLLLLTAWLLTLVSCSANTSDGGAEDADSDPESSIPAYVETIRTARAKIRPMRPSLLQKVTEEYNLSIARNDWPVWAERCLEYREVFEEAHELTLYPTALIAGIAMHESAGCSMSASDWAGGRGFMQLTHIEERRHVDPIATMLGLKRDEVHYHTEPLHNVLVGIAVLDDYERRLGSRPHGLLAYNMGVGGVRKAARKAGWRSGLFPEIVTMKPHLRYDEKMKPRVYVQRILASIIMMDRALTGVPIERQQTRFALDDIPGWNPAYDGEDLLASFSH